MTTVARVAAMTPSALLAAYDAQLRGVVAGPLPEGVDVVRDGPLLRLTGFASGGFIEYRDLEGAEGAGLDELIARQVRVFAERAESFEWKTHAHDLPPDLPDRLRSAGLVAEETETVVIAPVSAVVAVPALPQGVVLREVSGRSDLERIAARSASLWGDDRNAWIAARRPRGDCDRRRRGRRARRLRRLGALRARHRVRHAVGWRHAFGLAGSGHLPRSRRLPSPTGRGARLPLSAGRRLGRQPADPRAPRVRAGDDDHPVHLDAGMTPAPGTARSSSSSVATRAAPGAEFTPIVTNAARPPG
jgi:hypothetical protein